MDFSKVISCRPDHIVTEIRGVKEDCGKYKELKNRIWSWKWFYKFKLSKFEFKTIYVTTLNTITGETFYNDFYVHKDNNGILRLW